MKFEQKGEDWIRLTFEEEDIPIVTAVYSEHNELLASTGNPSSVSENERNFADPKFFLYEDSRPKSFRISKLSLESMYRVFDGFIERTDEEVARISDESSTPRFLVSAYQSERRSLGNEAEKLLKKLGGIGLSEEVILSAEPDAVETMFSGIEKFLGNQSGQNE